MTQHPSNEIHRTACPASPRHRGIRVAIGAGTALALAVGTVDVALAKKADSAPAAAAETSTSTVAPELGSMYSVVDQIGARQLWARGITGSGVNVALIDTGVAPVAALEANVVAVVDLSGEARVPEARYVDTYGHGTHMAGIIAGREPGSDPATADDHPEWFLGVAPDAGIVSLKVADNTGAVDITQVIAAVDWAIDHADELDIGVINLSYDSGSPLSYVNDPLAYAVERAWNAGIVVVAAAGNDGKGTKSLAQPAADPFVIAVAAAEAEAENKFKVPAWVTSGDGIRDPDVAAPGAHIDSLRAPGSRVDIEHPEGFVDETTFRGSGSSQAAAVVSGAAALLLSARPDLTPDQVKALLMTQTAKVSPTSTRFSGAGLIQLAGLVDAKAPETVQTWAPALGDGSIEAARGDLHMVIDGVPLVGEVTVLGTAWEGTRWRGTRWTDGEWMGTRWRDASWTGSEWAGTRWRDESWSGTRWRSDAWSDSSWTGTRWRGDSWADDAWSGVVWEGTRWRDASWSGTRWRSLDTMT